MYRYLNRSDFRFILFLVLLQSFFLGMALLFRKICMGDSHEYVAMAVNLIVALLGLVLTLGLYAGRP